MTKYYSVLITRKEFEAINGADDFISSHLENCSDEKLVTFHSKTILNPMERFFRRVRKKIIK